MYILGVPIVFVTVLFLALLLGALRCWRTALSLLFVALVVSWYGEVFPLHPVAQLSFAQHREEADTASVLRVMTYNVFGTGPYFAERKDDKQGVPEFEQWMASYNPDLILLEEIQHSILPYGVDSLASHYPYSSWNIKTRKSQGDGYDLVLSRYPIHDFKVLKVEDDLLPDSLRKEYNYTDPLVQSFHMDSPHGEVLVVHCHLKSNDYNAARKVLVTDTLQTRWIDGWDEYMTGIRRGYDIRPREAAAIRRYVQEVEQWTGPLIVAGDLNDIGGSPVIRQLERELSLQDAWWRGGFGFGFTYDAHHMLLRLDHILYSDHFRLRSVHVDRQAKFSDHRPLIGDFWY